VIGFLLETLAPLVVIAALAALVVRRALRRVKRGVTGWTGRFSAARSHLLPPGPRRDAALLRAELDVELGSTRNILENAPQGVIFRADSTAVLQELLTTALALDADLAAVERFPDPAQQRAALATLAPQVRQLVDMSYTARQTVLRTAAEDRCRRLETLQAGIAQQAAALETYRRTGRELTL
jgi:hypothetical protein